MEDIKLQPNERLDDLQVGGLRLIQDATSYCFTSDAVLLANFVSNVKGKVVVDMCSGSGIIATLIAYKCQPKQVVGIELQEPMFDMASRSVALNKQEDVIKLYNIDLVDCHKQLGSGFADCVVCNPPYRKVNSGQMQDDDVKAICRHEIKATLKDVICESSKLLKSKGSFYIVHQSQRLAELFYLMTQYGLQPKVLQPARSRQGQPPNIVIVKGVKDGNVGLDFLDSLTIFDSDNKYTMTIEQLYGDVKR